MLITNNQALEQKLFSTLCYVTHLNKDGRVFKKKKQCYVLRGLELNNISHKPWIFLKYLHERGGTEHGWIDSREKEEKEKMALEERYGCGTLLSAKTWNTNYRNHASY